MSKLQALIESQKKAKEEIANAGERSESVAELQLPSVPTGSGGGGFKPRFAPAVGGKSTGVIEHKPSVETVAGVGPGIGSDNRLPTRTSIADTSKDATSGVFSLADLDVLSESDELASPRQSGYLFADREKVTAPDRVYEEELSESQASFVELLDGIYEVLHDPEAFGSMIRTIMLELQEHGEYRRMLADSDVNVMMRGLRDSMGMAQIRKTEKSKGRSKTPTNKKIEQVSNILADLGFSDSDFDD